MEISYEDFSKLNIRIGTIREAERIPDADRLLRLLVDFGEAEPRTIVSGIATHFPDPSVLVGKQSPFLINIAPRTIRSIESQGMILAASDDDKLALLHPHIELRPGSSVG